MSLNELRLATRDIVDQLVSGDYESLVKQVAKSRLTSDDLRNVIVDYGRKLVSPPMDAYQDLDAVRIEDTNAPTWSVRAPLWTVEEGRSDLTLELTIVLGSNTPRVELDDLHAL